MQPPLRNTPGTGADRYPALICVIASSLGGFIVVPYLTDGKPFAIDAARQS
jgi:hypothetical protein